MNQENKEGYNTIMEDEELLSPKERRKKWKEAQRAKNPKLFVVLDWVVVILIALAAALCINFFAIVNSTVPSGSMERTIMTNSRMIGLRFSYWFEKPDRGDIIVFHYPIMDWENRQHGSVLIYGHIHNKDLPEIKDYYKDKPCYNCGADVVGFTPRTLEELERIKEAQE